MTATTAPDIAAWQDLKTRIEAWSVGREPALAVELLDLLRGLPAAKGKLEPVLDMMRRLQNVTKIEGPKPTVAVQPLDPATVPVLQLGAFKPDMEWPWTAAANATDDDSAERRRRLLQMLYGELPQKTLALSQGLAQLAAAVAPVESSAGHGARHWLEVAFSLRPREMWVPAAVEMSALLIGPRPVESLLARFEESAKKLASAKAKAQASDADAHLKRHVRTLALLAAVRAGDGAQAGSFAGQTGRAWFELAETDYDTLTAVAGALVSLAEREARLAPCCLAMAAEAMASLRGKFAKALTYQAWDAARRLIEAGGPEEAAWQLLTELSAAHGERSPDLSAGDLYDAGETLRWMMRRGASPEAIDRLLKGRLAGHPNIVAAARGEVDDWAECLASAFRRLSPERRLGLPRAARISTLVELAWLLEFSDVQELAWPQVVRGAGADWLEPSEETKGDENTLQQAAWIDLFKIARDLNALFAQPLHQRSLDLKTDKGMRTTGLERLMRARWYRSDDGSWQVHKRLSDQAGNQVVARLVAAKSGADRARIILAVLSADSPPDDTRSALSGVKDDELWDYVNKWWPSVEAAVDDAASVKVEPMLKPLVEWEKKRFSNDLIEVLTHGEELFSKLGEVLPEMKSACGPNSLVAQLLRDAWLERPRLAEVSSGQAAGGWLVGGREVASPRAMVEWCKRRVIDLAKAVADASQATVDITGEPFQSGPGLQSIQRVTRETMQEIDLPLVNADTAACWRSALQSLRELAVPLPWHTEGAVDALAAAVEDWIRAGEENLRRRDQLVEEFNEAMSEGREEEVRALAKAHNRLLGKGEIGRAGRFFMRRLRFEYANELRQWSDEVPRAWQYFAPLMLGVAGAPLSSIQTDKIWSPLLKDANASDFLKYAFVVVPMLAIALYLLYADIKKGASDLTFRKILDRGSKPLAVLMAINYGVNFIVWWAVAKDEAQDAGALLTTLMWGTLSLFLGIFLGLIAQGRGMAED